MDLARPRPGPTVKRRVVIVGGGIAGLTAAYELTRTPEARATWAVEVVEMGHRFGGRLASAHRSDAWERNEEHGLHVWFGFYDNTFRLAEAVWRDHPRPQGSPWSSVWDALEPIYSSDHGLRAGDGRIIRRLFHSRNCDRPGEREGRTVAGDLTGLVDAVRALPASLLCTFGALELPNPPSLPMRLPGSLFPQPRHRALIRALDTVVGPVIDRALRLMPTAGPARRVRLGAIAERAVRTVHAPLVATLRRTVTREGGPLDVVHAIDLGLAILRGVCSPAHGILVDGDLDRVSDYELRDWLREHGAHEDTLTEGATLEALYDIPFAFRDGDRSQPVMEAGTALRYTLQILYGYKHAVAYRLTAGAGEALVAPLYALLRERGVRFRPFLRLESVEVNPSDRSLAKLRFVRQARPSGDYDPLVQRRGGLLGLAHDPDWSQLRDGASLAERGVDFYSRFADRGEAGECVLEKDRDFDDVILALPLGSLKPDGDGHSPVAGWLEAEPRARACLKRLHLVPTVAAQVWLRERPEEIGLAGRSVVTWAAPYSVVCDMTRVIAHEGWPPPGPGSCAYMCGAWPMRSPTAPSTDAAARRADDVTARRMLTEQLRHHADSLFSRVPTLYAPRGVEPLDAQYVRANVEPWDLADLPLPGADETRLEATGSGLSNMALAGSWVRTHINTTSVEAAVASGIAAARALGAETQPIVGETLLRAAPSETVLPSRRPERSTDEHPRIEARERRGLRDAS